MSKAPAPPTESNDGADPSMEEILASIRRILNDDDAPAEAESLQAAEPGASKPAEEADDVLILDETMIVAPPKPYDPFDDPATDPPKTAADAAGAFEPAARPAVEPAMPEPDPEPAALPQTENASATAHDDPMDLPAPLPDLVAPAAAAAAASSVGALVRTLAAGRATQVYGGGPTLEDMVRAELRPLLKEWLDVYLPPMVERLVRIEIERVVGRCVP